MICKPKLEKRTHATLLLFLCRWSIIEFRQLRSKYEISVNLVLYVVAHLNTTQLGFPSAIHCLCTYRLYVPYISTACVIIPESTFTSYNNILAHPRQTEKMIDFCTYTIFCYNMGNRI